MSNQLVRFNELKTLLGNVLKLMGELDLDDLAKAQPNDFPGEIPYRVIHLNENPFDQAMKGWQQEFDELKQENERLKIHLELVKTGGQEDISKRIDDVVTKSRQVDDLIQRVAELKSREEKILASLGKTSLEFRQACYLLIGYRIDALRGNVYKLTHMYANREEDKLSFKIEPHGDIKFIEDKNSYRLSELITTYLKTSNSFPAFLAAITLHLFRANTASQTMDMSLTLAQTMLESSFFPSGGGGQNQTMNRSVRRTRPVVSSFGQPIATNDDLSSSQANQVFPAGTDFAQKGDKLTYAPSSRIESISSQVSAKVDIAKEKEKIVRSLKNTGSDMLSRARQVEELSKKVAELRGREEKILDSFKKTSREFREVCYLLTGYRVESLKEGIFRLSSMYAEREDDKLIFKIEDGGEIQLLANKYTERLSEFISTYLEEADSFPAFLAAITLDLFKSSTQSVDMSMTLSTTILANPRMQ